MLLAERLLRVAHEGQYGETPVVVRSTVRPSRSRAGSAVEQSHPEGCTPAFESAWSPWLLGTPRLSAARVTPPVSTTRTKICMACSLSMAIVHKTEIVIS